jgi:hypothetical protein
VLIAPALLALFTELPSRRILRTSPLRSSQKFVFSCYCTEMKRDAVFWWAVAATLAYAFINFFMVVFVFAMWAQFTAGS